MPIKLQFFKAFTQSVKAFINVFLKWSRATADTMRAFAYPIDQLVMLFFSLKLFYISS